MAYEHKPNTGSLFPNDRKDREGAADWSGKANINGTLYWVNMWDNEGRKGMTFKLVQPRAEGAAPPLATHTPAPPVLPRGSILDPKEYKPEEDEIPF